MLLALKGIDFKTACFLSHFCERKSLESLVSEFFLFFELPHQTLGVYKSGQNLKLNKFGKKNLEYFVNTIFLYYT